MPLEIDNLLEEWYNSKTETFANFDTKFCNKILGGMFKWQR